MGTFVDLKAADGAAIPAYVAQPPGKPRGGVVVVQEIFGVNSHIRAVADGYAAEGYLAVAPAIFQRVKPGVELGYAQEDMQAGMGLKSAVEALPAPGVMQDLQAAVNHAAQAGKVGIVGYCWGGTCAWKSASSVDGLSAAVCYYGGGIPGLTGEKPKCPVQFHWGEADAGIPMEKAKAVEAAHPNAPHYYYPGAGHGFNCDHRASYNADATKLAKQRTLEFFAKHVG